MKKKLFIFLTTIVSFISARFLVDEIVAIIYTPQGKIIINKSDIRPGLDTKPRTLRQLIIEELMIIDAQKLHFSISDADVERFLAQLQTEQGFNRAALTDFFKSLGYNYEEGIELLKRKQIIDYVIDYYIRGDKHMIVTDQDVKEHYEQHPSYKEPLYTLVQAFVPETVIAAAELQKYIDEGKIPPTIEWEEPFTLQENDLAEEKRQLVMEQPAGSIIGFDEVEGGVELTKLVAKESEQQVPLDEHYDMIVATLKRQRFYDLLHAYENNLLKNAIIRFTHPEDQSIVHAENV